MRSPARRLARPLAPATVGVFAPAAAPPSLPLEGSAALNDRPVACQTRGPTRRETGAPISRRRQPPPTHCGAPHRNGRDLIIATRPAHQPLPSHSVSGSGASVVFVSDGDSFAPRRELLLSAVTKVAKSTGRNCVSALPQRATVGCDFPHLLAGITFHHCCQSKGLRVRSPARRLTRPLASATVGVFHSYRHPPKPSPRVAHPLKPSP